MAGTVRITVLADAGKARAELRSVGDTATKQARGVSKLGSALKSGLVIGGTAAAATGIKSAISSGIEYQKVLKQTSVALTANGKASGQSLAALKARAAAVESLSGATLDENDVLKGQQNLLRAGIQGEKAFGQAAQVTADIAAARGTSFDTASKLVQKALLRPEKAAGALARQGVVLTKTQTDQIKAFKKSGDTAGAQAVIMGALTDKYKGAAKAAGSDATAGFRTLADTIQDMARDLVVNLLPAVASFAKWVNDNRTTVILIGGALAALAVGVLAVQAALAISAAVTATWSAAAGIATAAQWLWNAALTANPIGLIVLAVAALVAGVIWLALKTQFFQTIWAGLTAAFTATFGWIKTNWPLLLAILSGPIGLAVLLITKNWDKIKAGVIVVKDLIVSQFTVLVGFIKGVPAKIAIAARGLFDGIRDAFKAAINWIIDKWNNLSFGLPAVDTHIKGIGKVGGFTLDTPNIPRLSGGGTVMSGGLAYLHPAEVITPAGKASTVITVNVNVPPTVNPAEVGRQVVQAIRAHERAAGVAVLS